jgi:endonuclease-8
MRIVVGTDAFEAVAFNVPVAEFLAGSAIRRQEDLRLMGPDLLAAVFDEGEAIQRLRARPDAYIADALLNQRVVAGIGNVYKSEVLFLCGVNPFTVVAAVDEEALRCLLTTARTHMHANVIDPTAAIVTYRGYRRTTRRADPGERLYVYGRAGQACRRCGARIEIRAQGRDARLTYWCPSCQPLTTSSSAPTC